MDNYSKQLEELLKYEELNNNEEKKFYTVAACKENDKEAIWIGYTRFKHLQLEMMEFAKNNGYVVMDDYLSDLYRYTLTAQFTFEDMGTLLYNYEGMGFASEINMLKEYFDQNSSVWGSVSNYSELKDLIYNLDEKFDANIYFIESNDDGILEDISCTLDESLVDVKFINDDDEELGEQTIWCVDKHSDGHFYYSL